MRNLRRLLPLALVPGLLLLTAAPAPADDVTSGGQNNTAVAVNTEDGASIFRLAFSIRRVADGVVDQNNAAYALASCADCQTIALAFQVVLAFGEVDVAVPENRAVAYNDQCAGCVTYASAMQIVLGFDGPVRLTAEGWRRLVALRQALRGLEERAPTMTVVELNAEVQAAKTELLGILGQELIEVRAGSPADDRERSDAGDATRSTTTTAPGSGSTTTTSTTQAPTTSSPTSNASTSITTTAQSSSTTTSTTQPTAATSTTAGAGTGAG